MAHPRRGRPRRWARALLTLAFLAVAALGVVRAARGLRAEDVLRAIRELPAGGVLAGAGLSALTYLILTLTDAMALRHLGRRLRYRRAAFAAFVGYAFSQNLGLSPLTGGALRFRLYSRWGVPAREIAGLVAFNVVTGVLGFLGLAGALLVLAPPPVTRAAAAALRGAIDPRLAGLVCLAPPLAYASWSLAGRAPLRLRGAALAPPAPRLAAAQVLVGASSLSASAAVAWVLLPATPAGGFAAFLGIFLLAHLGGQASSVPGGLGVFDATIVVLLAPGAPAAGVVAALLAWRAIYLLLPLVAAIVALAVTEARPARPRDPGPAARAAPAVPPGAAPASPRPA